MSQSTANVVISGKRLDVHNRQATGKGRNAASVERYPYRSIDLYLINLWPLAVYLIAVILLIIAMLLISYVLGERHRGRATNEPYEAGVPITGSARQKLTPKFYLVAMFFVIFDLETVFVIAWALAARSLGWAGYIEILIFIGVLLAALVYLWRLGALEWGSRT